MLNILEYVLTKLESTERVMIAGVNKIHKHVPYPLSLCWALPAMMARYVSLFAVVLLEICVCLFGVNDIVTITLVNQ